jgi:ketosteroid isomerase-like protein
MTPLETVQRFVNCINARDFVGLTAMMTPDHQFVDSLGNVVTGRESMREGWRQYFRMVPDYHIDVTRSFGDGPEVVLLGSARGTYSRDGRLDAADAWQTPAAWHAIVRDGLVAKWQVFADNEPIRERMRRAPK